MLWETLEIPRDLTVEAARDIIARDLPADKDQVRALEYYGRILTFLEERLPADATAVETPAFTISGWLPGSETWWSGRDWVRDAFASEIAWWRPSFRDPSSHRRAGAYLGIREAVERAKGGPLTAR